MAEQEIFVVNIQVTPYGEIRLPNSKAVSKLIAARHDRRRRDHQRSVDYEDAIFTLSRIAFEMGVDVADLTTGEQVR